MARRSCLKTGLQQEQRAAGSLVDGPATGKGDAMRYLVSASLVLAGIIHLLPLCGAMGAGRLTALYGLDFSDANLAILMRHRAVLFGLFGAFLVFAACKPSLQAIAFIAAFVSVLSFLLLAWSSGGYNALVGRVVIADRVALVALVIGAAAYAMNTNH
jgi:hypothetical protein